MARGANVTVENQFTKGLITEFTAMNFPENAVTDADNCVFSEVGKVTPRLGVDYEVGFQTRPLSSIASGMPLLGNEAYVEYEWFSIGNKGSTKFVVQQIGNYLRFFRSGDGNLSANIESFSVNLADYLASGNSVAQVRETPCQFTTGNGNLFVVNPYIEPIYISYDSNTSTIEVTQIEVEVRDMQGVNDGREIDSRELPLSNRHRYNLLNQGWYHTIRGKTVLDIWLDESDVSGMCPSNADIWWLFKNATEDFIPGRADKFTMGNTPAPKGHYIYNAFNMDRQAKTGITNIPNRTSGSARPSAVCWYAGRVWYAGVRKDKYSSTLFFSQLVERDDQYGKCYQVNDPTSETTFDILDTDGGTILLPLIEDVVGLKVLNDTLVVLGTNAIYAITGADQGAFKATDYVVKYVSDVGAVSHLSLVEAEGALLWFNYEGIYALNSDQAGLGYTVNNISKQTIQSVFNAIPVANRNYIKGAYNKREQVIRWIFSDRSELQYFRYNRILDFNVASKAFYTHTISTTSVPRICGLISVQGNTQEVISEGVFLENGDPVAALDDTLVTTSGLQLIPQQEIFKFATTGLISTGAAQGFTYSEMRDTNYVDWATRGPDEYTAYCVSGYRIRGEFLRPFNINPVAVVLGNIPDGELKVSALWDYGERESMPTELYKYSPLDYFIRRVRLRGRGRSVQLKFVSTPGKPFELVGWSTFDTGGTQP